MHLSRYSQLAERLRGLDPGDVQYATRFVEILLDAAQSLEASDIHLQPAPDGLELRLRIDGVLQPLGIFPSGSAASIVARLKVLADLLTYRTDVPQEGRIRTVGPSGDILLGRNAIPERPHEDQDESTGRVEMRVSSFPTLYGEKAVVRLFTAGQLMKLDDLGLPGEIAERLRKLLAETSGAIIVTGPAGSGKTTTVYASLRELAAST
jgi:type II secretory ATPase GspE/PulE/Tfp pilus assembly ATPase PilB-like protein